MTTDPNIQETEVDAKVREFTIQAARMAADMHCTDVIVLDLRGRSPVTDYYVIATGTSDRQMRAVADDIAYHGKSVGSKAWHVAGLDSATWVLLDFIDVVVHLFNEDHRRHYDLEMLWGDAPRVEWRRPQDADAETPDDEGADS